MPAGTSNQKSHPTVSETMLYTQSPLIPLDPAFLCSPSFPSPSPRGRAKTPQVVETYHSGADRRNMSGSKGSRQRCGMRSSGALKSTNARRLSELKTVPISFSFPLSGIKERMSCSSVPSCWFFAVVLAVYSRQKALLRESKHKQFSISCGCCENCGYVVIWNFGW